MSNSQSHSHLADFEVAPPDMMARTVTLLGADMPQIYSLRPVDAAKHPPPKPIVMIPGLNSKKFVSSELECS